RHPERGTSIIPARAYARGPGTPRRRAQRDLPESGRAHPGEGVRTPAFKRSAGNFRSGEGVRRASRLTARRRVVYVGETRSREVQLLSASSGSGPTKVSLGEGSTAPVA